MVWMSDLQGLSVQRAEHYGKPHIGAYYASKSVNSHKLVEGAVCCCCGRMATNAHHNPPKKWGHFFELQGQLLRPALFAVCGSGTTGCHNGFHGGARFKSLWKWDSEQYQAQWWSGELFRDGLEPHSSDIYLLGYWELYDIKNGRIWTIRGRLEDEEH